MAGGERSSWRLRIGPYFGEVSALSFVPLPRFMSAFPLLLAGTGSELLVYDVRLANLVETFHVFEGVRVHGISLQSPDNNDDPFCSAADFIIAIYGERRVKLFLLCVRLGLNDGAGSNLGVRLELIQRLPGFDHWVLDVCFLKEDNVLAVGLSDNSVALWNLTSSIVVTRVKSSERCLLYSMRMWGNSIRLLIMASGTIFNEIIIWKLIHEKPHPSSNQLKEHFGSNSSSAMDVHIDSENYVAYHLNKLIGHEGSIFRMSWSSDGTKLMSVSDDRRWGSARIWLIDCQKQEFDNLVQTLDNYVSSDLTLFGHNARIWDCYISHSVAITAGEDCSCRVWATSGDQLLMLKEHIGRGIWRCLYDPDSSLLVSAGFDSAVKVHQITSPSSKEAREQYGISDNLMDQRENFQICIPKLANQLSLMDSKSEYVRCIQFTRENSLYIATNNGYLYHVELSNPGSIAWTELIQVRESQIICMDILPMKASESSLNLDDIVAIGDGNGKVTVVGVSNRGVTPSASFFFKWSAEKERQLLGVHWCRSLGSSYLFTSDPRGILRMWKIEKAALQSDIHVTSIDYSALLLAVFTSSFRHRIMCIDASIKEEVLICGDKHGNIILFSLVDELMVEKCAEIIDISPGDRFKGAHGISSVTSICIVSSQWNDAADIQTTGADGCICYFQYSKFLRKIEFIGMKQVKDLSVIQSVFSSATSGDMEFNKYAIGFTSVDFIMWDMTNDTKTIKIPCGGWRRPFSFHFGVVPEHQNCFAYVKDHIVHVHRVWVVAKEKLFPKVLHMQYHGKEIHSLSFISVVHLSTLNKGDHSWIATGCEDGSLRLARYSSIKAGRWSESTLLGEHVGGSAVRSICFIPKIYTFKTPMSTTSNNDTHRTSNGEDQLLLISVGSKQVLTSWILQSSIARNKNSDYTSNPSKTELPAVTFRWFSTQLPSKFASCQKGLEKLFKTCEDGNQLTAECDQISTLNSTFVDQMDNDWRYLAVTAFLLKPVDSRTTICFIVVACSDATLMLKALLLPYRLWFDVALLVPVKSPVLSLQHVVVPWHSCSKDAAPIGNAYFLISGSTDGSITFWDLTEVVESFVETVLDVQPQMFIDCQRRPKTGRGSQGGRRWKSLSNISSGNTFINSNGRKQGTDVVCSENEFANLSTMDSDQIHTPSSTQLIDVPKGPSNIFPNLCEIHPLCVLSSLHQSGVNCLNVAEIKKCQYSKSEITYCVLSGGDDQSLHLLVFGLQVEPSDQDAGDNQSTARQNYIDYGHHNQRDGKKYKLNVLSQNRILSAHNSAIKGVWTDGTWAFTTGLDQRIRCWQIDPLFRLSEHANVIISVPEPETLDAIILDSGGNTRYQIAVAGRGLQMVEFTSVAGDDE